MSYLQNQINAFKTDLTSSSSKISNKRSIAAPATSSPSPAPSNGSATKPDLKRKRPEASNVVYSQPDNTGPGRHIMSQVAFAVTFLKGKDKPQSLQDILGYLSLQREDEKHKFDIKKILQNHDKIEFDRSGAGGKGTYQFKPIHNIRSKDQLLGFLQKQSTAQGLSVRELKDGWVGAEDAIDALEDDGKLLVTRNKKDSHPKMVWPNDPSLSLPVDSDFHTLWHKVRLPEASDLTVELERAGLTPTSKSKTGPVKPKEKEKKRKKPRAGGRITNTHMASILRDYTKK
ncbi:MAG: hypothetical protein M1812_001338 [Candelaria pacifica]|nr:MAG: hypothetical protein M1812_001338 [Candelaria pacifica]